MLKLLPKKFLKEKQEKKPKMTISDDDIAQIKKIEIEKFVKEFNFNSLFTSAEQDGGLVKLVPWLNLGLSVIVLIVLIVKK